MMRNVPHPRRERGFGLLEAMAALAVFAVISYGYSQARIYLAIQDQDRAAAGHGSLIQAGVNNYINDNRLALITQATPVITGIADPFNPTLAELQTLNGSKRYVAEGYDLPNALGMTYTVSLSRMPVGCTPGVNCTDITGMMTAVAPLLDPTTNEADGARIGHIASIIGVDAAASVHPNGSSLVGEDGPWVVSNPRGNVPGILALRLGWGSVGYQLLDHLLPRSGERPMTGNLNMGTNSIVNVNQITATGSVQAGEFFTPPKAVGDVCTNPGATASGLGGGNGVVMVCSNGTWQIAMERANAGDACTPDGKIATSVVTTEQLICKNGIYVRMVNMLAKNVEIGRFLVTDGMNVPKPACETGGVADYSWVTTRTAVDVAMAPPKQGLDLSTVDNGTSWTISIKLQDNFGGQASGNAYNLLEIFKTECRY